MRMGFLGRVAIVALGMAAWAGAAEQAVKPGPVQLTRPVFPREFVAVRPYPAKIRAIRPISLYLPKVDLRPTIIQQGIAVRSQGGRGTCSVFAMTFLQEFLYTVIWHREGMRDLSEDYLNSVTNLAAGNKGDGDFFANIDLGYQTHGAVTESLFPYHAVYDPNLAVPPAVLAVGDHTAKFAADFIKPWDNTKGATEAQLQAAIAYLDKGIPVAAGLWWPTEGNFKTMDFGGVDIMRVPGKPVLADGHSVALVGYRTAPAIPGGGYFIFRNSWGQDWGDQGYGYMPYAYVLTYANDLVAYQPRLPPPYEPQKAQPKRKPTIIGPDPAARKRL